MINFADYKTASAYAQHINAGASARLSLRARECIALNPVSQAAWFHGWDTTDAAERLAGRGIPCSPGCSHCGKDHPDAFCPVVQFMGRRPVDEALGEDELLAMAAAAQRRAHGEDSKVAAEIDRMRNDPTLMGVARAHLLVVGEDRA